MHASKALGVHSKQPARDRDAARPVSHPISRHRQPAENREVLRLFGGESLEENQRTPRRIDLQKEVREMEGLLEGFFRLKSVNRFFKLDSGPIDLPASQKCFGQPPANEGHVRIETASDLEFHSSLVESSEREGGQAEFPVCFEVRGLDLQDPPKAIDRFGVSIQSDQDPSACQQRFDRRGILAKFGHVELEGSFGLASGGEDRSDTSAESRHARRLPHGLAIAPAGAIEFALIRLKVAHGHQAGRHLLEGLLREEVGEFGILESIESMKSRDSDGVDLLFGVGKLDRSLGMLQGLFGSIEAERQFCGRRQRSNILGKEHGRLSHRGKGLFQSSDRLEHHRERGMPFPADRVDLDRTSDFGFGFGSSAACQEQFRTFGMFFGLVPVAHGMISERSGSRSGRTVDDRDRLRGIRCRLRIHPAKGSENRNRV